MFLCFLSLRKNWLCFAKFISVEGAGREPEPGTVGRVGIRKAAGLAKHAKPFHEKAIQVKADVAAFLKIIASVWLHDSTPTHGRRQPAAAPTQVCVCMGPLSLISGRGSERPGDVKSARSGRGAAKP